MKATQSPSSHNVIRSLHYITGQGNQVNGKKIIIFLTFTRTSLGSRNGSKCATLTSRDSHGVPEQNKINKGRKVFDMENNNVYCRVNGHTIIYGCENQGYTVIEHCELGADNHIVLAYNPNRFFDNYATWYYSPSSGSYFWGHYITNERDAYIDYYERIQTEVTRILDRHRCPF